MGKASTYPCLMEHHFDINGFGVAYSCLWLLYVSVRIVIIFAVECCKVPLSMTRWYRSGPDVIWQSDTNVIYEFTDTHSSALLETQLRRSPIKPFEWANSMIWFWSTKGKGLLDIFHREQLMCVCRNLGQHRFWVRFHLVIFFRIYIFSITSIKLSDQTLPKFVFYNGSLQTLFQIFMTLSKWFYISTKSDTSRQHFISWSNVGQSFVTRIHWFAKTLQMRFMEWTICDGLYVKSGYQRKTCWNFAEHLL